MNAPITLAQVSSKEGTPMLHVIKLVKPADGQAVTVNTGYEGKVRIDFSGIADERISIVRVGETAVIYFHGNKSTITLDPFFGSNQWPLANLEFELGTDRIFGAEEIAALLPFTVYQGILPAADGQPGNEQDSGASFNPAIVADLPPIILNELMPPEVLPPVDFRADIGPALVFTPLVFAGLRGIVEEDHITKYGNLPGRPGVPFLSEGNEGPTSFNHVSGFEEDFDNNPDTIDGDDDTWQDTDNTTHQFKGQLEITGGSGNYSFALLAGWTPTTPLFSKGQELSYHYDGNILVGYADNGMAGPSSADRIIFTLELSPTGEVTFTIYDQLDHATLDGLPGDNEENNLDIDFSGLIEVTDNVASQVLSLDDVSMTVIDDVPVLTHKKDFHIVDEDDIKTGDGTPDGSYGTSPNDGDSDGSYTGNPNSNGPGPATVSGNLQDVVRVGTDEHKHYKAKFSFLEGQDATQALGQLSNLGLSSKGGDLSYYIQNGVLYGYVNAQGSPQTPFGPADRIVFTLTLESDGDYTFRLYDQMDHDQPHDDWYDGDGNSDENFDLEDSDPSDDVFFIDFGSLIQASDFDHDRIIIDGKLKIAIRDDVPEVRDCDPIFIKVNEDDIKTGDGSPDGSYGTSPNDGNGDGSYTGDANSNGWGPATVSGSLTGPNGVVISGADEPLTFSFAANTTTSLNALGLRSKGGNIRYEIQDGTLFAYVNTDGIPSYDPQADRLVFEFIVDPQTGEFVFKLWDQVDHDHPYDDDGDLPQIPGDQFPNADQNHDLRNASSQIDVSSIDFGQYIEARDNDGDTVSLDGKVIVKIIDDIPEVKCGEKVWAVVEEEHLPQGNEDFDADPDLDEDHSNPGADHLDHTTTIVSGSGSNSLASLVEVGADEGGKFTFKSNVNQGDDIQTTGGNDVYSDGFKVEVHSITNGSDGGGAYQLLTARSTDGRNIFTLKIYADGDWTFTLLDQLDHHLPQNADNEEGYLALDFSDLLKFTDFDGDTIDLDHAEFFVKVIDDVPTLKDLRPSGKEVQHDETPGIQNNSEDDDVSYASLPQAIKDTFDGVQVVGNDPHVSPKDGPAGNQQAIGYAWSEGSMVSFNASVGADQPGKIEYSLKLSSNGTDSGLETTEGRTIRLYNENGVIVGRYDKEGDGDDDINPPPHNDPDPAAFAITVDANGNVYVVQYVSLKHPDDDSHDESVDIDNGKIKLEVKVTDEDGDWVKDDIDISSKINFDDDGPKVNSVFTGGSIIHDETSGDDGDHDTNTNLSALFSSVASKGNDPHVNNALDPAIGYAQSNAGFLLVSAIFGSDGPHPSQDYKYELDIGSQSTTLQTTEGRIIRLFEENGIIVGRYDANNNGTVGSSEPAAFAIHIDADTGVISVVQYVSLKHPLFPDNHDEPISLALNNVQVKVTAKDGDNDTDSETVSIGDKIIFEDDGPKVTVTVGNFVKNGLFLDGFVSNSPTWGEGSGIAAGPNIGTSAWVLTGPQLERVGEVYAGVDSPTDSLIVDMEASPGNCSISQNVTGLVNGQKYQVSFEVGEANFGDAQLKVYWNGLEIDEIDPVDGPMQVYTFEVIAGGPNLLTFEEVGTPGDNTGTYLANIAIRDIIIIDETPGVDADADDTIAPAVIALFNDVDNPGVDPDMEHQFAQGAQPVATYTADFGADGPHGTNLPTYSLSIGSQGMNSGLTTTEGRSIHLFVEEGGKYIVGRYDTAGGSVDGSDPAAFALTIDPVTGKLSVALYVSLEHPDITSHDEGIYLDEGTLFVNVKVTDGDLDTASDGADISQLILFEDDGPKITSITKDTGYGDELITNGSFEQGHGLVGNNWEIFASIADWEDGADGLPFEIQTGGAGGVAAFSGSALVELDGDTEGNPGNPLPDINPTNNTNAIIQQTVHGTVDGQTYELTFWYHPRPNDGDADSSSMNVLWNGAVVHSIDSTGLPDTWQQITVLLTATGDPSILGFQGDGQPNELGALIDLVSLRSVPSHILDDEDTQLSPAVEVQGGPGDDGSGVVASGKINFNAGADGLKSIVIGGIDGLQAIWVDGDGVGHPETISYSWVADGLGGGTLTGSTTNLPEAFTIEVHSDGNYTFTLIAPLNHPLTDDPSTSGTIETSFEDNLQLDFPVTITDGDDDTATGTLCINVDDDSPQATGVVCDTTPADDFPTWPQDISHIVLYFGQDAGDDAPAGGDGYYLVKIDNVPDPAPDDLDDWIEQALEWLIANDPNIDVNSDLLGAVIKGGNVDGSTQFFAYGDHNLNGTDPDTIPSGAPQITTPPDQGHVDGPAIDQTYSFAEVFPNGIPTSAGGDDCACITVDEGDIQTGSGTIPAVETIDLSPLAIFGADGEHADGGFQLKVIDPAIDFGSINALGQEVKIKSDGNILTGFVGANTVVFTLEIDANGDAVFKLYQELDHGQLEKLELEFGPYIIAVDGDGDAVDVGSLKIKVEDGDTPFFSGTTFLGTVEEEDLNNLIVSGTAVSGSNGNEDDGVPVDSGSDADTDVVGDWDNVTESTSGTLTVMGGDGALIFTINAVNGLPVNFAEGGQITSKGQPVHFIVGGPGLLWGVANGGGLPGVFDDATDRIVFTVVLNPTTGHFVVTLNDQLDHHPSNAADDVEGIKTIDLGGVFKVDDSDAITTDAHVFTDVKVQVIDDVPVQLQRTAQTINVDEDELGGDEGDLSIGITDLDGVTDEAQILASTIKGLVSVGADEDVTISLNTAPASSGGLNVTTNTGAPVTSKGASVQWAFVGGAVIGYADDDSSNGFNDGDRVVFRITQSGVDFVFDLEDQIDHGIGVNNDDDAQLALDISRAFRASDFDGDSIVLGPNSLYAIVENDIPSLTLVPSPTAIIHDESAGLQTAGAPVANVEDFNDNDVASGSLPVGIASIFSGIGGAALGYAKGNGASFVNITPGADEPVVPSYTLDAVQHGASGLVTTDGRTIHFWRISTQTVVGYVDNDGDSADGNALETPAVAITVDPLTGEIYVAQWLAIDHPTEASDTGDASYDEAAWFNGGVVKLLVNVEDADDDHPAQVEIDLGGVIQFEDDGPSLTANPLSINFNGVVQHDETQGVQNGAPDAEDKDVLGSAFLSGGSGPTVASLFAGVLNAGSDPHVTADTSGINPAIGYARSGGPAANINLANVNFGTDGAGDITYSLVIAGNPNLFTTEGRQILLFDNGDGVIVGRYDAAGGTVESTDPAAFAMTVDPDTGELFMVQYVSLRTNATGASHDEDIIAASSIQLKVTFEDGDNDAVSAELNIGSMFQFDDDGPSATNDGNLGSVQENDSSVIIGTVASLLLNDDFGSDGQHATTPITIAQGNLGGTVTIVAGNLVYTPDENVGPSGATETFVYTIMDGDGDTTTATFTVDIDDSNFVPQVVLAENSVVDEDGLANANVDGSPALRPGETNSTELSTDSGTFVVEYGSVAEATGSSIALLDTPGLDGQLVALNGNPITFALVGDNLVGTAAGNPNPIITIDITGSTPSGSQVTYDYTVTLHQPIQHPVNSTEDSDLLSNIQFQVTDGVGSDQQTGSFNVTVWDDIPVAQARAAEVTQGDSTKADVVLIIDRSGSMGPEGNGNGGSNPPGPYNSRLAMVKDAIEELFNSGAVNSVFIVHFGSGATHLDGPDGPSGGWYTNLVDALAAIDAIDDSGSTDYDAALDEVMDNFTPPPAGGERLVSLFLSDGVPNESNDTGSNGIDEDDDDVGGIGEETAWIDFLDTNDFDASYALGFGGLSDADKAQLEPIAWNGTTETADNPHDADQNDPGESGTLDPNVIIIDDITDIGPLATALISAVSASVSGDVIDNNTATTADDSGYGADGPGYVSHLHVDTNGDGVVDGGEALYTFNGTGYQLNGGAVTAANSVTFATPDAGEMTFNFATGEWDYTTPDTIPSQFNENFNYKIKDDDGDESAAADLDITVHPLPTLAVAPASASEGSTHIEFTVSLSHGLSDNAIPVTFSTTAGTATGGGTDFGSLIQWFDGDSWESTPFSFAPGQTSVQVRVALNNDSLDEADETFTLTANALSGTSNGSANNTGTIQDNDAPVTLSIDTPAAVQEGVNTTITFTVTKSAVSGLTSTVVYTVNPGTAGTPGDYTGTLTDTITFLPGELSKQITLNIVNDGFGGEPNENFTVTLSSPTNATINVGTGTGTIIDAVPNAAPVLDINIDNTTNVRDEFANGSYSNNNGRALWTGAWIETGDEGGGVSDGEIEITSNALSFDGDIDGGEFIERAVDLSGATSATVTFNYTEAMDVDENIVVEAWNGTTNTWQQIGSVITGTTGDASTTFTGSLIAAQIGAHTKIRLRAEGNWDGGDSFTVDNFNLAYGFAAGHLTTYLENNTAGVAITDTDTSITDANVGDAIVVAKVKLTNAQTGDELFATGLPGGFSTLIDTSIPGEITLTINGSGAFTAWQDAIESVRFRNNSENPGTTDRVIHTWVNDGEDDSNVEVTTINVIAVDDAPTAVNDIIRVNTAVADGTQFVVPEWALLHNDSDPDGDALDVTGISGVSDLSSVGLVPAGSLTVTNNTQGGSGNDSDWGSFTYTLTAGGDTDNATVTVVSDTGAMSGNADDDEIFVGTGGNNSINGNAGDDILIGNGGADTLNGGDGNDLIVYATGLTAVDGGNNTSNNLLTAGNRGDILSVEGTVDFTALTDIYDGIETISMLASDGSAGNNTITFSIVDVLDMADQGAADPGGAGYDPTDALRIDGTAGDVVNLANDAGTWLLATGATGTPDGYTAYVHVTSGSTPNANEDAYLFVATGITVNGTNV